MYNLGKQKKHHKLALYYVLEEGFRAAFSVTNISFVNSVSDETDIDLFIGAGVLKQNKELYEEFEKYCIMFSKAAEGFEKKLGKEFVKPEVWRKSHQNFKIYLLDELIQKGYERYSN